VEVKRTRFILVAKGLGGSFLHRTLSTYRIEDAHKEFLLLKEQEDRLEAPPGQGEIDMIEETD
jgi:hypothetical protein